MPVDLDTVATILEEVAAEEVLPRFRKLRDHEVRAKEGGELVTVADLAAEAQIERRLRDLLPGARFVGEEAVAEDPGLLDLLESEDDWIWVVDPIDGTGNFAGGTPVFAVMAGLVRGGETAAAWIHDPVGGRTATAERGAGAWLNRRRLTLAAPPPVEALRGTLHAGTFAPPAMVRQVQARRARVGAIKSLRCAGWEYLRLATGEMQFSLFTKLKPWDHVPGALIYREAGGLARTLDGAPYGARSHRAPGLLLAPDEASWQWLHDTLFGDPPPDRT
ncbi:MAG: inositol monophosphatase [Proteobacteria bacterium]|nr:inositol monophosphatase [Pseudomonadota bacterium]